MALLVQPRVAFAAGLQVLGRRPEGLCLRYSRNFSLLCSCRSGDNGSKFRSFCTRSKPKAVLRPRVAVVGGGFGGLVTALKLESMPWTRLTRPEITLVDRSERFSFLPMMYELATGEAEPWEVAPRFDALLADSSIRFVHASAESLVFGDSNAVELSPVAGSSLDAPPSELEFDRAILALGCEPASLDRVPGAAEHAMPLYGHKSALALRDKLSDLRKSKRPGQVINVVVVGGGFSGVECASCVAEMLGSAGSVLIVDRGDRILARGTDYNRVTAERALVERGVIVQYRTAVESVSPDTISLIPSRDDDPNAPEPSTLPADVVIWSAGVRPNSAIANLGVPLDDATGLIAVNKFLEVPGYEDILLALGDCATMPPSDANGGYSGTAQVAAQQAEYAAWNAWASLTSRRKLEYRYAHLGEMLVLGARDASVTTTLGVEAEGATAWGMRRAAYLARMPTDRHRGRLAVNWAVHPVLSEVASQVSSSSEAPGAL